MDDRYTLLGLFKNQRVSLENNSSKGKEKNTLRVPITNPRVGVNPRLLSFLEEDTSFFSPRNWNPKASHQSETSSREPKKYMQFRQGSFFVNEGLDLAKQDDSHAQIHNGVHKEDKKNNTLGNAKKEGSAAAMDETRVSASMGETSARSADKDARSGESASSGTAMGQTNAGSANSGASMVETSARSDKSASSGIAIDETSARSVASAFSACSCESCASSPLSELNFGSTILEPSYKRHPNPWGPISRPVKGQTRAGNATTTSANDAARAPNSFRDLSRLNSSKNSRNTQEMIQRNPRIMNR